MAFGLDYVVVDAEHGHLDWGVVLEHIRATVRSKTCAFVRLQENGNVDIHNSAALVKRALDIGADGVLVPCVETAEQCRVLVSQARYPFHEPSGGVRGIRGIGGERATLWGQNFVDHVQEAAEEPPAVPSFAAANGGAPPRRTEPGSSGRSSAEKKKTSSFSRGRKQKSSERSLESKRDRPQHLRSGKKQESVRK